MKCSRRSTCISIHYQAFFNNLHPFACDEMLEQLNLVLGANEEGLSLVHLLGHDLKGPNHTCGALAAGLLSQEAHGGALVQQTQLAIGVLLVAWVAVDATVQQGAVEVTHQGANVASAVGLAVVGGRVLNVLHVSAQVVVPQVVVALVEAVDLALLRDLHVPVGQHKLANSGIQSEAPDTMSNGQHNGGGARVQAVAGALQVLARLAHVQHALLHHLLRVVNGINGALLGRLIHTPDGAHTDTGINVGGAIQRVKAHDVVT
mmetsp:Transcript_14034/g.37915  ORF Transcript_14034/g.37915 Transcript_14034/m.37915 type:complete len:261 (-) Transcript_14034:634-1416(-)